jgi:hypothetical protein
MANLMDDDRPFTKADAALFKAGVQEGVAAVLAPFSRTLAEMRVEVAQILKTEKQELSPAGIEKALAASPILKVIRGTLEKIATPSPSLRTSTPRRDPDAEGRRALEIALAGTIHPETIALLKAQLAVLGAPTH